MWMLLLFVAHLAFAFPANWNETVSCPRDALYSSLVEDGGGFCSSVLEGKHCGAGYSTPAEYVRYNQTRIASYCVCIVTSSEAVATSSKSSGATTQDNSFTVEYSDTWTTEEETSASVGQPASETYPDIATTEVSETTSRSWNQTRSALTSFVQTTEDVPTTGPYTNTSSSVTETLDKTSSEFTNSRNITTGLPTNTHGSISESSSLFQNQTSGVQPTSPFTQSGNQTQSRQSSTDVTPQPSDTSTRGPGMTISGTTSGSLPWPIPGNLTSSPSGGVTHPTGPISTSSNSSLTIPSNSIPGTGLPFLSAPLSTTPLTTDSGISSSLSAGPGWNVTVSPSAGNVSVPTISIPSVTLTSFPTLSLPTTSALISSGVLSSDTTASGWNGTASRGNGTIPTASLSSDTLVPFPTITLPTTPLTTGPGFSSSVAPGWNSTTSASRGNGSAPSLSIPSGTFMPLPTLSLPSQSSSAEANPGTTPGSISPPNWNSTSIPPSGNFSVPIISISQSETLLPFPTTTLSSTSQSSISSTRRSDTVVPSWNITASPSDGNVSIPTISISQTGTLVPFPTMSFSSNSISITSEVTSSTSSITVPPSWNGTTSPSTGNVSVPTISLTQPGNSLPFPTIPSSVASFSSMSEGTSMSTQNGSAVPGWNTTTGVPGSVGSGTVTSSSESGVSVSLPTDSELPPSITQSGGFGWNLTSSISGAVSLPTISVPASEIPAPIPSLPLPTDSFEVPTSTETGSATAGGNTAVSAPGSTEDVTHTAALSQETCYTLPGDPEGDATRRALLFNSRLREENVSIPMPYIESVEFESDGVNPLYLTVRDEEGGTYFVDISHRGRLSVVDPSGYLVTLDADGIHFSGSNCTYDISITMDHMYTQIAELAGVQCAALRRQKRANDLDFSQILYLRDQCGNVVDKSLRQYPQLLVGDTACADVAVDEVTGRWDFDCTFPGSQSGPMRCQWAVKNIIIDFITIDPFGGSCPDLSTVVTTLEESGQDIVGPSQLRKDLANQGLRTERARQEADEAVSAYTLLWQALGAMFSKNTGSSKGALEKYIDVYNSQRNFENDICQALHEGEIPLNLTLIAGATKIPAITTLNWAPESPRTYNITVQDSTRIACCPDARVAEGKGATCAYPREAIIPGTGCVCGTTTGGEGIAFEWTECGNFAGSCEADGDCGDGYVCLTGSCCGRGVCVDAYACSENGTALVQFDGGF
ncbi:hypothetical protein FLAG1_04262 [Fusarium langsethiae]|uniref:Uncharacterized protein n=1 Tax=Fusarium langsethiae TaxID=179993 RepID=A0A0N1J2U4_FUSLA|nr:hypothetical protein FLAG1_04262 [Fusarium langsethiae]GKU04130.1 unnamed protein product [Fusarium langsethiae]GKU19575.1 unnamed protein product [Fusarium langsethiae]